MSSIDQGPALSPPRATISCSGSKAWRGLSSVGALQHEMVCVEFALQLPVDGHPAAGPVVIAIDIGIEIRGDPGRTTGAGDSSCPTEPGPRLRGNRDITWPPAVWAIDCPLPSGEAACQYRINILLHKNLFLIHLYLCNSSAPVFPVPPAVPRPLAKTRSHSLKKRGLMPLIDKRSGEFFPHSGFIF